MAAVPLLLVAALSVLQPASAAMFFFSRDEVSTTTTTTARPAPQPAGSTAPCVCSLADWCQPLFDPKVEVNEVSANGLPQALYIKYTNKTKIKNAKAWL